MENALAPLPRIEDFVKNPTFSVSSTPRRLKQSNDIFVRAMRGDLGPELAKVGITTPSIHPMDRTVFSPAMLRAELWSLSEADVWKWPVEVPDAGMMSRHIKDFAKYLGADLVGITHLHPAFVYEDARNGRPVTVEHKYAVVMAKAMDRDKIATTPSWVDHVEVGKTYQELAVVAIHLAKYIGQLGYPARASFAGNDSVLHIPLAVYAGLGELSRMDRLITERYGPRVRLCTVTTDLPLQVDHPVDLNSEHFCNSCRKCAVNCPARAIPTGEKREINGIRKWVIDGDACYRFFRKNRLKWGDCLRCVAVCPRNKPDTHLHRAVGRLLTRVPWSHRPLRLMDDLLYGRKPKQKIHPWQNAFLTKEEHYRELVDALTAEEKCLGRKQ